MLKVFSIIWSIFLLTLAAYPCCEEHTCHEGETNLEIPSGEQFPMESPCSPLHNCHTSLGFLFNSSLVGVESSYTEIASNITPKIPTLKPSTFLRTIWQPPQQ